MINNNENSGFKMQLNRKKNVKLNLKKF